jgi:hypothetical protein
VPELVMVRGLLQDACQCIEKGGNERIPIGRAKEELAGYRSKLQGQGTMTPEQKKTVSKKLLTLSGLLKNSGERVLAELRAEIGGMGELVNDGDPHGALRKADAALILVDRAEELAGMK